MQLEEYRNNFLYSAEICPQLQLILNWLKSFRPSFVVVTECDFLDNTKADRDGSFKFTLELFLL